MWNVVQVHSWEEAQHNKVWEIYHLEMEILVKPHKGRSSDHPWWRKKQWVDPVKEEATRKIGEGKSTKLTLWRLVYLTQRDWCLLLSWCLEVGIGVSSRLVSMNMCKNWCLLLSWCLTVGIGISSRLVSANICKRMVSLAKLVLGSRDWCLQYIGVYEDLK